MPRGGLDNEWLNKLRDANDLVSLMQTYMPLKRMGRKYWANCPFHHEKTPSLCINEDEQYYHCFGCGESGNVINFVMKIESLDFIEALHFLAKRCGMQVPKEIFSDEQRQKKNKRDRAYALLAIAKDFYKKSLNTPAGDNARQYLITRGITEQEIEKFELGYSPDWTSVLQVCKEAGYSEDEMREVGLLVRAEDKKYDFFAKRLMYPIHDKYGDCVGFSGRDIEGRTNAKYKNSPQSMVFDKSSLIYGYHLVKKLNATSLNSLIICEGQMDVIAMHKAGFTNSVACLGTAMTDAHAREITRLVDKVYICFDGDSAGQNATIKAINVLKNYDITLRVVVLPKGKDPDEIIKDKGKEYLQELIMNAMDFHEFEIRFIASKYDLEDNLDRSKFLKEAVAYLNGLSLQAMRDVYLPLVSQLSKVSTEAIRRDLTSSVININQEKKMNAESLEHKPDALLKAQRFILSCMLHKKDFVILNEEFDINSKNPFYNNLYKKLFSYLKEKKEFAVATILDDTKQENLKQLNEIIDINLDNFEESEEKYYRECVKQVKIFNLTQKEEEIKAMISQEPDLIIRSKLLKNLQDINKEKFKIKTEG